MKAVAGRRSSLADTPALEGPARVLPLEIRSPTADSRCVESTMLALETAITPTDRFFIRSHFAVPEIDPGSWNLEIGGHVQRPLKLVQLEIRKLPHVESIILLECAGNSRASVRPKAEGVLWGNGAVGTARWAGIRLRDLLEKAGVKKGAREVLFEGADGGREPGVDGTLGFAMSIPMEKALDSETLLADQMNGEPLSPNHGFPLRAIVPGWYGMSSVKWLKRITVMDQPFVGYYQSRAYVYISEGDSAGSAKTPATSIRVKSLITWPREGQRLSPGVHSLRGVAWSGTGRIVRVEVNVGDRPTGGRVASGSRRQSLPRNLSLIHI